MNERTKIATKTPNSNKEKSVSQANKTELSQHPNSPIDHILYLQRTIGNQAVGRLFKSGVIQAKLKIDQPEDEYEQEGDKVAEQVLRKPDPQVQRQVEDKPPPLVPIREPAIMDVSDELVYMGSNRRAVIFTTPPNLSPMRRKIPWDSQVKVTKRYVKDSKSYVYVKKAYGDKSDWGWTLEDNLDVSDVPTKDRYGCLEAPFYYFIKNDKYLQPQTIYALNQIDNPIEITKGEVTDLYHLRLTECMYPSRFTHKSKGHYTGHCVDIAFTGAYGGEAKKELEKQGKKAFVTMYKGTIYKHYNHLHGCVSFPSWVSSRSTTRLKKLLRERKDEY